MSLKFYLRSPEVQQGILELIFPLLGYFYWGWSFVIIIVFYLLDWFASQIMYTRRLYKVMSQFNQNYNLIFVLSIFTSVVFVTMSSILLYFYFLTFDVGLVTDLNIELITFLKAELWYLLPLIILSYYMMDKMLFYMPKSFTNYSVKPYFYSNFKSNLLAFIFVFIGLLIQSILALSGTSAVFVIVICKFIFDLIIKKEFLKIKL